MADDVKPVAKRILVYDDVVGDPTTGRPTVLNIWETVRPPAGKSFPYTLAKLCVFVCWRDGYGAVNTRIDIVRAVDNTVVQRTRDIQIDFPHPNFTRYVRYKIDDCEFPESGYYVVELHCDDRGCR